jgi:hypothetical protein
MKTIQIFLLIISTFFCHELIAQRMHPNGPRGRGHHGIGPRHARRVVVRSVYRPAKIVVYHPYWRPAYTYNRRWVYFPRRNFYWDNWRNHWLFWNGTIWISQPSPPPGVSSKELETDKNRELKENEDDVDDVYKQNEDHKKEDQ